jgi:two-component system, NarL family, sensor kinase
MSTKEINQYILAFFLLLFAFLIIGTILTIIFIISQRRYKFSKQLNELKEQAAKNLLTAQIEMQEQTFQYIAQEIHDHIGQRLTLAKLYLNSRKEDNSSKEQELVEQSAELIGAAITDLKYLSRSLTTNLIKDNGLLGALQLEAERLNKLNGLQLQVITDGNTRFMEAEQELIIFRIIQEALQNILKHAGASTATIHLLFLQEQLQVTVTDNGTGFYTGAQNKNHTAGLRNMEQRAKLLGGSYSIQSRPQEGTSVEVIIPYYTTLKPTI